MQIKIDPTVTFEFPGKGNAVLDAYDLVLFKQALWDAKATIPEGGSDKELPWATIVAETTAYVKDKAKIDLSYPEAMGLYLNINGAWEAKKKSWEQPVAASPTSQDSTDPRYAD